MQVDWRNVRVVVNSAGRVRCEPGWALSPKWVQTLHDFDLWFVWAGRGRMILKDRQIALRPGICIWARPGRYYEAYQDPDDRLGVSFIHFDLVKARSPTRRVTEPVPPEVNDLQDVALTDATMRRIVELYRDDPRRTAEQQHWAIDTATSLMSAVLMNVDYESSHQALPSGIQRRYRQLALELASRIDENPAGAAAVTQLARQAGYTPEHFTRVFKSVVGQTPQAYTINARINRARQLLRDSDLNASQIAQVLGYADVYFFSRQFKQKTGQTPSEYRRSER